MSPGRQGIPEKPTILVVGARGQVGSAVVAGLAENGFGGRVLAGLSGRESIAPGGEIRLAPLDDRYRLGAALAGVDRAFLMVPFGARMHEYAATFIDCAREQGVHFVVRLSGLDAGSDSSSAMGRLQGELDAMLQDSGIASCILRCNSFMQNFVGMYRPMLRRGRLALAQGGGRISFVDTGDIGRAAAAILCNPGDYRGEVLDLNGPEALDNAEVVALVGREAGREINYLAISEEHARAGYRRAGLPEWEVAVFASLDRFLREGNAALDDATLRAVLRREPVTFAQFARRHRDLWRARATDNR